MILIADPKVLAIPICENQEKMVDMQHIPQIVTDDFYFAKAFNLKHNDHTFVRESVSKMLIKAQSLMPKGWYLKLFEGHRSLVTQGILFDKIFEMRQLEFPNLSHENIFNKALEVVSPVINLDKSNNTPPHCVGGAVDVLVVDENGSHIFMGEFPEDDLALYPETFPTFSTKVAQDIQEKRQILCVVMEQAGFINYPFEWWHYSYGDRYWAFIKKEEFAFYDLISDARKCLLGATQKGS